MLWCSQGTITPVARWNRQFVMGYKVLVYLEVGTDEWEYHERTKIPSKGLMFVKDIELPFPPMIGLRLTSDGWPPTPLESARYDIDLNSFYCSVPEDNEIPEALDHLSENVSLDERRRWVKSKVEKKKEMYVDDGWELRKSYG